MARDKLRAWHLFAIESVLPFGMGIINKAKSGGLPKIIDVFQSKDPISEFQVEGETTAKRVRDKIDQFVPGLGHPVVSVDVTVEENSSVYEANDDDSLVSTLHRIDHRLDQLRRYIIIDSKNSDNN
tara:strand:- start:20 stop:397 length:378 start_codon:yes stop_codon:yes gene_type:complete